MANPVAVLPSSPTGTCIANIDEPASQGAPGSAKGEGNSSEGGILSLVDQSQRLDDVRRCAADGPVPLACQRLGPMERALTALGDSLLEGAQQR